MQSFLNSRRLIIAGFVAGFVLVSANTAVAAHYGGRVYPGTRVAGVKIGGLTRQRAQAVLKRHLKGYRLDLVVDGQRQAIDPREAGVRYDVDATLDSVFSANSDPVPLAGLARHFKQRQLKYAYSAHESALEIFTSRLSLVQDIAPVDAAVVVENGQFRVQPDKPGFGIDKALVEDHLRRALAERQTEVVIEKMPVQAEIRADSVAPTLDEAKQIIGNRVELTYQGKKFVPNPEIMASWLTFSKSPEARKLEPGMDLAKIKQYLDGIAQEINVAPVNKKITAINGEVKNEEGGQDGLAVDTEATAAKISAALLARQALTMELPTYTVKFKTVYNRTISLDYGRYIEINLSMQRLWAYQDHQLVYESPVTSGATGAGFPTAQGLFSIYGKERGRYLNGYSLGYNYNVYVEYWMPFYRDYGLHDASWRNSFGGSDYYYNGSHGCVNLPYATAAWLFGWADVGTPVWIHG